MSPAGFDLVIPLFEFRVLFGFNQNIGNLGKKSFQIIADTEGILFFVALVIT